MEQLPTGSLLRLRHKPVTGNDWKSPKMDSPWIDKNVAATLLASLMALSLTVLPSINVGRFLSTRKSLSSIADN